MRLIILNRTEFTNRLMLHLLNMRRMRGRRVLSALCPRPRTMFRMCTALSLSAPEKEKKEEAK